MNKILIIGGPTASGKSAVSMEIARKLNGEIISADSAAVYRGMDIGTAKPDENDRGDIRHHLIDICEISDNFNVATFAALAKDAIADIASRGKLPILVGGTGFYIRALLYDADFDIGKGADERRAIYEDKARRDGAEELYQRLMSVDFEYAKSVHPNNVKRVIRALEFYEQTGLKFSEYNETQQNKPPAYDFNYFVLTMPREILYKRINDRVDMMIENGLLSEVQGLNERGAARSMTSMQAIGYKQMQKYLNNECTFDEAVYDIKRDTRHFAKRQMTWWRKEKGIIMLDVSEYDYDPKKISEAIIRMC